MADSAVAITAGTGTNVDTFQITGGDHQQVVREARATAVAAPSSWTPSTTGTASAVAADASRVSMLIVNNSSSRVYFRLDATIPSSTVFHWYLDAGDRWEVPAELATQAVSMLAASSATGTVLSTLATSG
jgi:hypothetical protein